MFYILIILTLALAPPAWAVKAFPSAEGFGAADTKGGRGGAVMLVTNLNDSGPGSFRACAEGTGPRTCVFRVGGIITLSRAITISEANSYLTIAGQTAPGEGVTLTPWPINIAYGAHDVIIRHLRHRQAFPNEPQNQNNDCAGFIIYGPQKSPGEGGGSWHVHHIILDHVSVGYTCDDSMQMSGYVTDSTIQWSLVADPYDSAKGDPYGSSKGFIFGGNNPATAPLSTGTVHHSMFLHSGSRNPAGGPQGVLDWRYNIIYNWFACTGGMRVGGTDENVPGALRSNHNFVGNRYIAGPDTNTDGCWLGELRTEANAKVYVYDNVTPWCGMDNCQVETFALGWGNGTDQSPNANPAVFRALTPFAAPSVTPTARSAMEAVLSLKAGATVPKRDALDTRVIKEMQTRTGDVGRKGAPFPTLPFSSAALADSDSDGMPDAWETAHGLNPNNAADRNGMAGNGYTNLENYLNELAGDDVGGQAPPDVPPATSNRPIYLSAGGHDDSPSDSGDCTAAENIRTPRASLSSALACMKVPGKVLYIRGGTYAGIISTEGGAIRGGLTVDAPTRIEGYQTEPVLIQLPEGGVNALEINGVTNLAIAKLTVDAMGREDSNALACMNSSNVTIKNSVFRNAFYEVAYFHSCNQVTVTQSKLYGARNGAVITLVSASTDITFDEIDVSESALGGLETHPNRQTNKLTITRSQFRDTGKGAGGAAIDLGPSTGARIVGNMFDHNSGGIRLRKGVTGAVLADVMIASTTGVALQCDAGMGSVSMSNLMLFSNGTDRKGVCTSPPAKPLRKGR